MAKTDWNLNDTVLPSDMNQIGQEINELGEVVGSIDVTPPDGSVTYAKLAVDVKNRLNVVTLAAGTNVNTLITPGLYAAFNGINAPVSNVTFQYHVMSYAPVRVIQTAYSETGNMVYTRSLFDSTWSSWNRVDNGAIVLPAQTDLNTVMISGNYFAYDAVNGFSSPCSCYVEVISHDYPAHATQTAYDLSTSTTFTRRRVNNVWGGWNKLNNAESMLPVATDLNTVYNTGKYWVIDSVNRPSGLAHSYIYLDVILHNADWVTQTAYDFGSTKAYMRRKSGGTWTAWVEFLTTSTLSYVSGTYTGDGTFSRDISLPFTPSAVMVDGNPPFGWFAVTGNPSLVFGHEGTLGTVLAIGTNKFTVSYGGGGTTQFAHTNDSGTKYNYIAFK